LPLQNGSDSDAVDSASTGAERTGESRLFQGGSGLGPAGDGAFALHFLLEGLQRLVDVVVANENLKPGAS
jgi:hypothetical protein